MPLERWSGPVSVRQKRLERGRFLWPPTVEGTVIISMAQTGLSAARHRLAHVGENLAEETQKRAPQTADFLIPWDSWTPIFPLFRTTSMRWKRC
jgi:hypothetical protein